MHVNLFPVLGLGAQVPFRRSGLTFNPEFCSFFAFLNNLGKTMEGFTLGYPPCNRLQASRPGAGQLVHSQQHLPGTTLGSNRCEYLFKGLTVQPRVGARAPNRQTSRESFLLVGAVRQVSERGQKYVHRQRAGVNSS